MKSNVLFICTRNSARSQMAEAFLNHFCSDDFVAESAGLEAGSLNPLAVRVMSEVGIDISGKTTQKVFEVFQKGRVFRHVISLCDESNKERCPMVVKSIERHHWGFQNPSGESKAPEEKLERMREIRDQIQEQVSSWCDDFCDR